MRLKGGRGPEGAGGVRHVPRCGTGPEARASRLPLGETARRARAKPPGDGCPCFTGSM